MSFAFNTYLYVCKLAGAEISTVHVCVQVTVQTVIYTVLTFVYVQSK